MIETCYGNIEKSLILRAKAIKMLICDVDGVLSNGLIFLGNQGEELKSFNVRDGYGIRCLLTSNIEVAIITGRRSQLVANRAKELGITHCYQGQSDKLIAFDELIKTCQLLPSQVAYIGDDLIDLPVMSKVGLAVAVADAHPMLKPHAHYVTQIAGGYGAVRELCDIILLAQDKLAHAKGLSI